jgi:transposase
MSEALFVGIDVAKDSFCVACRPEGIRLSLPNNSEGHRNLVVALRKHRVELIVMEATGGYERSLTAELLQEGFPVVVANPRQVRDFARGLGKMAKTDPIDADVLAQFAQTVHPTPRAFKDLEFAEFVSRRRQLVELHTQESNRLDTLRHPTVRRRAQSLLRTIQREIDEIEQLIQKHIQGDDELRRKDQILRSTPGVGPQTSAMLLAHLPELGQISRQAIAALAGLAPWDHKSGKFNGRSHIFGGRSQVRSVLYMAALTATRCNPQIKAFYQRLIHEGKLFKVAITACMRKLLITLNTMLKEQRPWSLQPKNA